jgi:hypothetical protein
MGANYRSDLGSRLRSGLQQSFDLQSTLSNAPGRTGWMTVIGATFSLPPAPAKAR